MEKKYPQFGNRAIWPAYEKLRSDHYTAQDRYREQLFTFIPSYKVRRLD